jgi:hypothetical protein
MVVGRSLLDKLGSFEKEVELCDDAGKTVGHFLPVRVYQRLLYAWAQAQFSEEELERASKQPGGRTTAEVLERLGKL